MPRRREPRATPALELKSTRLSGIQVLLHNAGDAALKAHIDTLFASTPDFFDGEFAIFDCLRLPPGSPVPNWAWLAGELRARGLNPLAVRHATAVSATAAKAAGLVILNDEPPAVSPEAPGPQTTAQPAMAALAAAPAPAAPPPPPPVAIAPPAAVPTLIVDKPLRSGQRLHAQGGDLIVLAVVNPGAEVIADGSIHVYAPLKGRALAGARGDTRARIFTTRFEAELVSIAGVYRTFEDTPDPRVHGRPTQIRLADASQLCIEPL
jgi:septum site-determining protein MinC